MDVCGSCKEKLIEFYNFKMRSEKVRDEKVEFIERSTDIFTDDVKVYDIVQIVKGFMDKYPVCEILEDETEKRLIVMSKAVDADDPEDYSLDLLKQDIVEEDYKGEEEVYVDQEVFFPTSDDYIEEAYEEELLEDADMLQYEDNSECSFDNQESSSECLTESGLKSPPARRPRNPESWACNKRKTLRNSGLSYLNTKGKLVEGRRMRASCGATCRSKCDTKITEADREREFNAFWNLGEIVKQRKFLDQHIEAHEPKRRQSSDRQSSRSLTLRFYLEAENSRMVHVCKKMFLNTLAVSSQVIQGVVKKYSRLGFQDKRGKFPRKLTQAQELAVEHVKKFPFFYIERTMTKVQCYQMYCEECVTFGIEPVKEGNYRAIFDRQNHGSFLKTELIDCEFCLRYSKATDEERLQMHNEHVEHIELPANKKCRERALGRIRHQRLMERKRAQRMEAKRDSN